MELLVFGDTHIKPIENAVNYELLEVPADVDVVISIGDVIHDAREDAIDYGHEFFERLASFDTPVLAVPGNHDPVEYYPDLTAGLPSVVTTHKRVVTAETFDEPMGTALSEYTVVGWGCEEFDQGPELRPAAFPSLTPDAPQQERRYVADQIATELEDTLYEYVTTDCTEKEILSRLGIQSENAGRFSRQLQRAIETYEDISTLISDNNRPTIVCSHVPPYNTEADRHHSIGEREENLDGLHVGSIGLKLALRIHEPFAAFHGHSHNPNYEVGFDDGVRPHSLNLGFQGIIRVSLNGSRGSFGFNRLA